MIKAQALANFVTKLVWKEHKVNNDAKMPNQVLYSDRLATQTGGGAGIILEGPQGIMVEHSLHFDF